MGFVPKHILLETRTETTGVAHTHHTKGGKKKVFLKQEAYERIENINSPWIRTATSSTSAQQMGERRRKRLGSTLWHLSRRERALDSPCPISRANGWAPSLTKAIQITCTCFCHQRLCIWLGLEKKCCCCHLSDTGRGIPNVLVVQRSLFK